MSIIYFFGPDGSGKTTMAMSLAEKLRSRSLKVKLSWMRGTHTLASMLARFFSKFATFRGSDNPYYSISIPNHMKRLWQLIEFISMLPVLLVRFMLPSLLGYTVIAERYIPDFLVWVVITTDDPSYLSSISARFLLALALRAKAKIYVKADLQKLIERRMDMDPSFIMKQLILYEKLAEGMNSLILDTTNRSVDESMSSLLAFLDKT
uniref:AAA family ATPase n=1 Tax=Fervidicoccus fontis TaxID=683846 RepID=A0A7J3SM81_9CREN